MMPDMDSIPVKQLAMVDYFKYNLYSAYKFIGRMFYNYDVDTFGDDDEFLEWLNSD